MSYDIGWIYCITCDEFIKENKYKIGMTQKNGIDEEVKNYLITRYGTSYPNPIIKYLYKVSNVKKVEKEIFTALNKYKITRELFCTDINIIYNNIENIIKKYPFNLSFTLDISVYNDLMTKLEKKLKNYLDKTIKDSNTNNVFQRSLAIYFNNKLLNDFNHNKFNYMYQYMYNLRPPFIKSTPYTKEEKLKLLRWKNSCHLTEFINNWDLTDIELEKFLYNKKNLNNLKII